jgi:hypothetical protein
MDFFAEHLQDLQKDAPPWGKAGLKSGPWFDEKSIPVGRRPL